MSLQILEIDYHHAGEARILEACLSSWFQNPKDLHLTDPRMTYPFDFKKWKNLSYGNRQSTTFVLKQDGWIIGMASLKIDTERKCGHLFHVFIAPEHRRKGLARQLVQFIEERARQSGATRLTLTVVPKNSAALRLYASLGFSSIENQKKGQVRMVKELI